MLTFMSHGMHMSNSFRNGRQGTVVVWLEVCGWHDVHALVPAFVGKELCDCTPLRHCSSAPLCEIGECLCRLFMDASQHDVITVQPECQ